MDRLRHAAQVGDIDELYKCIREEVDVRRCINDGNDDDELINETPLHIAVMGGHVDFAKALMYLKPSWGGKLNHEMYSPMHLAVVHGYNELVLSLLAVDKDLARVKGKDGYTALHYAAEKGNLEVLAHFLKDCPECLEDVTIQDETALHVAAQNGQLEALQILARYVRRVDLYCKVSKGHLLNCKDRNGDTVLHIAASNMQLEMIKVLLECRADEKEINKGGLTASHLLERQSGQTPDREKCSHMLHNAKRGKSMTTPEFIELYRAFISGWGKIPSKPLPEWLRSEITGQEQFGASLTRSKGNMSSDKINALLVVLALILAAIYQALINPPGGVWQGSYQANTTSAETHVGQSIMTYTFFSQFFALNLAVFIVASSLTVGLLQIVSGSNVVGLISEILLSLLFGCVLLARQVIRPSDESSSFSKTKMKRETQLVTFLSIYFIIAMMEFVRRISHHYFNPPTVRYFQRFFGNQIQMYHVALPVRSTCSRKFLAH